MTEQTIHHNVRRILLGLLTTLAAASCSPRAARDCFTPASGTACTAVDGGVLLLSKDKPLDDLEVYCESECLDVTRGVVVDGFSSLADAPLVAKLRNVGSLQLYVDTLTDLQGIESITSLDSLSLRGMARRGGKAPPARFSSLRGLQVESLRSLSLSDTFAVLDGAELNHVEKLSLDNVASTELDVSKLNPAEINVSVSNELISLRLGNGPMKTVVIDGNAVLTTLEWDPTLRVSDTVRIISNDALSSCRALDFANQTRGSRAIGSDTLRDNGPCP